MPARASGFRSSGSCEVEPMPLLLDRSVPGAKTHAVVIGVGNYPHAKSGKGVQENLRRVPDLPSAADSAKLMCD